VPYSDFDPAWAKAALVGMYKQFTHRSKFYVVPDPNKANRYVYPLPGPESLITSASPTLRIAFAGDIGTCDLVMENLLKAIKLQDPHIIIHLGDIYVAGTSSECNAFWKTYTNAFPEENKRPPLWSIPGNHEYIDAGEGYFTQLVNKSRLGDYQHSNSQEASYFCLENEALKLQILGLDTGYNSKNFQLPLGGEEMDYSTALHPKEAEWAQERLIRAKERGLRTILLTHHQLYSAFWKKKKANTILGDQILKTGQTITAWLWGHEHRVGVYGPDEDLRVRSGQCLGHGAIPEMGSHAYRASKDAVYQFDQEYVPDAVKVYQNFEEIYNTGFALMEVQSDNTQEISMSYFQVDRVTGECSTRGTTKKL